MRVHYVNEMPRNLLINSTRDSSQGIAKESRKELAKLV